MWTLVLTPADAGPPPPPAAPVAAFTASCTALDCTFTSTGSSTGAPPLTYAWDFGDSATSTAANPPHTYGSDGTRTVKLTVTDALARTATISHDVTVSSGTTTGDLAFVAANESNSNTNNAKVTVPNGTQAGDGMVLIASWNSSNVSVTSAPAGWTLVDSQSAANMEGQVYRRTATGADAGSTVALGLSGYAKTALTVAVYRGAASGSFLAATGATAASGTARVAPAASVATSGSWVLSYWSDKSSATSSWNAPGAVSVRSQTFGSGGGRVSSLLADSGAPVSAGTSPARTATSDASGNNAVMWTLVLAPA
jgi:PKD repeat protein